MDQPQVEIPTEARQYLEGILNDANMATLDSEMREGMINEMYQRLDSFLATKIVENMSPEYIEEFIAMNEQKKPREEIEKFVKEKMPSYDEVFKNAFVAA